MRIYKFLSLTLSLYLDVSDRTFRGSGWPPIGRHLIIKCSEELDLGLKLARESQREVRQRKNERG